MAEKFDLVVIGAGPGGYVAAIRAAQLGLKVACIEKEALGGTCLNVGCIPSKTLLHWTESYDALRSHGPEYGFDGSCIKPDWEKLQKGKQKVVSGFKQGIGGLFRKNRVELYEGVASFVSNKMAAVETAKGKQTVEADNFLIATGSEPVPLPFLPFDEARVLSSTGALSLPSVPKSMIVIGAGVIGVELASVYRRLGCEITVVEMLETITPTMDHAISKQFQQILEKQGFTFFLGAKVTEGEVTENGVSLKVAISDETKELSAEVCLVAVGRRAYTKELGLSQIKVETTDKGLIRINDRFQTSVPNIYAIGDVVDGPMLAHKASEEGVVVAELLAGHASHLDYMTIPNVIYTAPEVASVGLTEQEARDLGIEAMVGLFPFKANSRARCIGEAEGTVKVIGDQRSGRLIGLHIVGHNAGEMVHEGVIALEKKALVKEIAFACHAHPTLSEAVKEAALAAIDKPIHM